MLYRTTPYLVVQPKTEQDISALLAFCSARGLSVFPRGSGSFAFGGVVPTRNGIVADFSPMNAVLEIEPEKRNIRVQPGARWADVAKALEPYGLAPVTTPTSRFSTVAGWISTGGMGLDSYGHGTVYESVLGVRVARPDGSLEELKPSDESLKDLFGIEGQLGVLTEITLRVRPKPKHSGAFLLAFNAPDQAFEFIEQLASQNYHPSHVAFFDQEYMKKENILFAEHTGLPEPIVPEQDTVLLHFETPENEQTFLASLNGNLDPVLRNQVAARYLWADRYFPLKAQRISRGLLGAEAVIPPKRMCTFMKKVRNLARHFKIKPAVEVIVSRSEGHPSHLVIVSFGCDYTKSIHYILSLLFIQLLVRMAVRCGGHPYGIGIWNTPFIASRYKKDRLDHLKRKKQETDPSEILNPNKFFKIKGRFFSIPALFMHPIIFRLILGLSHFFAPALGVVARITGPKQSEKWNVPSQDDAKGKTLLHECAQRCTSCGSCIAVCPAYYFTKDELVTGRAKLLMAEAMLKGVELQPSEAQAPFQCLHCGLCEEVCQTHLPLRDCYQVLEDWIENRFGSAAETVQSFIEKLDSNRNFIYDIFGLDLPEWSPNERLARVPAAERASKGEA
jgi:FAD/FMN-containing dehydrogenase/heterodisulfide reductase subunit C